MDTSSLAHLEQIQGQGDETGSRGNPGRHHLLRGVEALSHHVAEEARNSTNNNGLVLDLVVGEAVDDQAGADTGT